MTEMEKNKTPNLTKLQDMIHYIVSLVKNPNDLGEVRLNKILWYSDLFVYSETYESISGVTYIKAKRGPKIDYPKVLKPALENLTEKRKIEYKRSDSKGATAQYKALKKFTDEEAKISLGEYNTDVIKKVVEGITKMKVSEIVAFSHNDVYENAEMGGEISLMDSAFKDSETRILD